MNDDHADSLADYARHFAKLDGVTGARLAALDAEGMDLEVHVAGRQLRTRVAFQHHLRDATDARETLIAMAREAAASR